MNRRKLLAIVMMATCFGFPLSGCITRGANMYMNSMSFLKPFFTGLGGNVWPT